MHNRSSVVYALILPNLDGFPGRAVEQFSDLGGGIILELSGFSLGEENFFGWLFIRNHFSNVMFGFNSVMAVSKAA